MADDLIRDDLQFPLGDVTKAEVKLSIGSGSLRVSGGSDEFCDATFEYSHPELQPEIDFDVDGNEATLDVRQPRTSGLRNVRQRWDLRFNSKVAIELGVASGSGGVRLDLDDMNPSDVDVESASGNVEASLAGEHGELEEVLLDVASGNMDLRLGGAFPRLETVEIGSASGRMEVKLTGDCPALRRVEIGSASGNIDLDLTGSFARDDLGVRIQAASGNVTVRVPEDVGVSMSASMVSGRLRAGGFTGRDGRHVNRAFGSSDATIWLNIQVVSGNINVST